jgi:sec-independent protein translocase protein TatB
VFDLSIWKIAVLGVIALVVFGPDQLPKMAAQAGRALRDVRRLAESARADLSEHLGPEFSDFDINELNPKYFVRKHLLEDLDASERATAAGNAGDAGSSAGGAGVAGLGAGDIDQVPGTYLEPGENPPWDIDAT